MAMFASAFGAMAQLPVYVDETKLSDEWFEQKHSSDDYSKVNTPDELIDAMSTEMDKAIAEDSVSAEHIRAAAFHFSLNESDDGFVGIVYFRCPKCGKILDASYFEEGMSLSGWNFIPCRHLLNDEIDKEDVVHEYFMGILHTPFFIKTTRENLIAEMEMRGLLKKEGED